LARTYLDLALFHTFVRRDKAHDYCTKAIRVAELLLHDHPDVADYQCLLAGGYGCLAMVKAAMDRVMEGQEAVKKGLALLQPTDRDAPRSGREYLRALAGLKYYEGVIHYFSGQLAEAESSMTQGIKTFEQLAQHSPIFPNRILLVMCYPLLGQLYDQTNRPKKAEEIHRRSLETMEQLARDYPSVVFLKGQVLDRRVLVTVYVMRRGENVAKLLAEADALAQQKDVSTLSHYNLACVYALASAHGKSNSIDSEKTAKNAMEQLIRAEKSDFFKSSLGRTTIKTDSDLNSLRERDDFKALVKRVQQPAGK
jgi:tetratricopeptide (TPR) repeat protein